MVADAIEISSFGANDSPVILTGFTADPDASFPAGTAVFAGKHRHPHGHHLFYPHNC